MQQLAGLGAPQILAALSSEREAIRLRSL